MHTTLTKVQFALVFLSCCAFLRAQQSSAPLGNFEGQSDVGTVLHPGTAEYDAGNKTYAVSGSGDNMWFATDQFHFVWKKVTADDVGLTAEISILSAEGNNHRKGVLMIRQSLDTDSAYVDAARHGDGLTSMQFRVRKGATTNEVESNVSGPQKLRLEKHGDRFYMWISSESGDLQFAGGSARVEMQPPFYVGLGVTAHDKDAVTKVAFRNVELGTTVPARSVQYSTVETVLQSGDARTGFVSMERLTSPGWSDDAHFLTFQVGGEQQQAGFTPLGTASPVSAAVNKASEDETLYFSKKKGGHEQIWRKKKGEAHAEQLTFDDCNNTLPRLSPDGKLVAFLSYSKRARGRHNGEEVSLRTIALADKKVKTLATFAGGRDSLGKQPWSPDGKRLVFVSYQALK